MIVDGPGYEFVNDNLQFKEANQSLLKNNPLLAYQNLKGVSLGERQVKPEGFSLRFATNIISNTAQSKVDSCLSKLREYASFSSDQKSSHSSAMFEEWIGVIMELNKANEYGPMNELIDLYCEVIGLDESSASKYLAEWALHVASKTQNLSTVIKVFSKFEFQQLEIPKIKACFTRCLDDAFKNRKYGDIQLILSHIPPDKSTEYDSYMTKAQVFSFLKMLDENKPVYLDDPGKFIDDLMQISQQVNMNEPNMKKHVCRHILQVVDYGIKNQKLDRLADIVNLAIENYGSDSNLELLRMMLSHALNSSNEELFASTINLLSSYPLKEHSVGEVLRSHIKSALGQNFHGHIYNFIQSLQSDPIEQDTSARFIHEVKLELDIISQLSQYSINRPEDLNNLKSLINDLAESRQLLSLDAKKRIMSRLDPLLSTGLQKMLETGDSFGLINFVESVSESYYEMGNKPYIYEFLLLALNQADEVPRYFEKLKEWCELFPSHIEQQKSTISSFVMKSLKVGAVRVKSAERTDTESLMQTWLVEDGNDKYLLGDARMILYNQEKGPQIESLLNLNLHAVTSLSQMIELCSDINSELQGVVLNENSPSLVKINSHLDLLIQNEQLLKIPIHSKLVELATLSSITSSTVLVEALLESFKSNFDIEGTFDFIDYGLNQLSSCPRVYNRLLLETVNVAKQGSLEQVQSIYNGLTAAKTKELYNSSKALIDTAIKDLEMVIKWKSGSPEIKSYVENPQSLLNDIQVYSNNPEAFSIEDLIVATDCLLYQFIEVDKASALLLVDAAIDNIFEDPPLTMLLNQVRLSFELGYIEKSVMHAQNILSQNPDSILAIESAIDLISHAIDLKVHLDDHSALAYLQNQVEQVLDSNILTGKSIASLEANKRNQRTLEEAESRKALLDFMSQGGDLGDYILAVRNQYKARSEDEKLNFSKEVFSHYKCIVSHMKKEKEYGQLLKFTEKLMHIIKRQDVVYCSQVQLECGIKMNRARKVNHAFYAIANHSEINSSYLEAVNNAFEYFLGQGDVNTLESIITSYNESLYRQAGHMQVAHQDAESLQNKMNHEFENIKYAFKQFDEARLDDLHSTGLTNAQYNTIMGLVSFIKNPLDDQARWYFKNFMRYLNSSEDLRNDIMNVYQRIQSEEISVSVHEAYTFDVLRRYCYKQGLNQNAKMHKAYSHLQSSMSAQKIREKEAALVHINEAWKLYLNEPLKAIRELYPNLDVLKLSDEEINGYLSEIEKGLESEYLKISESINFMKIAGVDQGAEKISLAELKNINSICTSAPFIESLNAAGILPDSNTLDWIKHTQELVNEFMDMSTNEHNLGDFAFRNLERFKKVTGKVSSGGFRSKAEFLATMHGHAAIYDESMGYKGYTHLLGTVERGSLSIENFLCDDVYAFHVEELLNTEYAKYIQLLNDALIHNGLLNPAMTSTNFLQEAYQGVLEQLFNGPSSFNPIVETSEDQLEFIMMKKRMGYKLSKSEKSDYELLLKDLTSKEFISLEDRVSKGSLHLDSTAIFDQSWLDPKKANRQVYNYNKKVFGNVYNTPKLQYDATSVSGKVSGISKFVNNLFQKKSVSDDFSQVDFEGGMICSAFQAKVTLKALSILNNKLNEKMAQLFPDFPKMHGKVSFIDMPTNIEEDWSRLTPMRSLELFSKALKPSNYTEAFYEMVDVNPQNFKVSGIDERSWTQKGFAKFW